MGGRETRGALVGVTSHASFAATWVSGDNCAKVLAPGAFDAAVYSYRGDCKTRKARGDRTIYLRVLYQLFVGGTWVDCFNPIPTRAIHAIPRVSRESLLRPSRTALENPRMRPQKTRGIPLLTTAASFGFSDEHHGKGMSLAAMNVTRNTKNSGGTMKNRHFRKAILVLLGLMISANAARAQWVALGIDDCFGADTACSAGATPDPLLCNGDASGTTAVCWDGVTYSNGIGCSSSAWCTYKAVAAPMCTGGSNLGYVYECTAPTSTPTVAYGSPYSDSNPHPCRRLPAHTRITLPYRRQGPADAQGEGRPEG